MIGGTSASSVDSARAAHEVGPGAVVEVDELGHHEGVGGGLAPAGAAARVGGEYAAVVVAHVGEDAWHQVEQRADAGVLGVPAVHDLRGDVVAAGQDPVGPRAVDDPGRRDVGEARGQQCGGDGAQLPGALDEVGARGRRLAWRALRGAVAGQLHLADQGAAGRRRRHGVHDERAGRPPVPAQGRTRAQERAVEACRSPSSQACSIRVPRSDQVARPVRSSSSDGTGTPVAA